MYLEDTNVGMIQAKTLKISKPLNVYTINWGSKLNLMTASMIILLYIFLI